MKNLSQLNNIEKIFSTIVRRGKYFLKLSLKRMLVMDIFMNIFKKRQCFLLHLLIKNKILLLRVLLTLESVRNETTTSRGCKSPYVFIEVVLLFIFSWDFYIYSKSGTSQKFVTIIKRNINIERK
jgi:hypothetical protein